MDPKTLWEDTRTHHPMTATKGKDPLVAAGLPNPWARGVMETVIAQKPWLSAQLFTHPSCFLQSIPLGLGNGHVPWVFLGSSRHSLSWSLLLFPVPFTDSTSSGNLPGAIVTSPQVL